jgi:methyl-accepting chemotaxis protein
MTALFSRLNLASKLFASPVVCLLFMIVSGGVAFWGLQIQKAAMQEMHTVRFGNYARIAQLTNDIDMAHTTLYRLISWSRAGFDAKKLEAETKEELGKLAQITEALKGMATGGRLSDEEKKRLGEVRTEFTAYAKDATDMLDMLESDVNAATMYMGQAEDKYLVFEKKLAELMLVENKLSEANYALSQASSKRVITILVVVVLVSILVTLALSWLINLIIMKPINSTVAVIESLAAGDLTKRIEVQTQDEIGNMANHMNAFIDALNETMNSFSRNAQQLASTSAQLNITSDEMASGSEQVASQAATVATAGEEMTATSRDIAQNCQLAADSSQVAMSEATSGSEVVRQTVAVMNRISERVQLTAASIGELGTRSDQIGAIIGTIEDIADQTNLLALNAAIEAARAGDQGRGFAVVADEVRALAERTTKATREIGEMIKSIQLETRGAVTAMEEGVREVMQGTREANRSGEAIQKILDQINSVTMQVNQIATAAEEQTATTSEISGSMHQITDVVHNSSRSAQDCATEAQRLAVLAVELQRMVSRFKLA